MEGFGGEKPLGDPFGFISKMGTAMTKPLLKMGEIFTIPENDTHAGDNESRHEEDNHDMRMSIEGTLYQRKGKSHKWKRRIVILKFEDGGSFECYKIIKENPAQMLKEMASQLSRGESVGRSIFDTAEEHQLMLLLRMDVPWMARDINDPSSFVVEIPTDDPRVLEILTQDAYISSPFARQTSFGSAEERLKESEMETSETEIPTEGVLTLGARAKLEEDFKYARSAKRPLRLYFKCSRQGNEKSLWLRGFAKLGRLSPDAWNKRRLFGSPFAAATSRLRQEFAANFTRDLRRLEMGTMNVSTRGLHAGETNEAEAGAREFRALPTYCYRHAWMTHTEMREECNLPSTKFHDLRLDSMRGKEIGTLKVEVLQCFGLPKLDKNSESDGVVYLVCGSYAFATDVIENNNSPIWMRKSRRACIFPIFHGYARLFVGVFDHDGFTNKDDFAGRVVIDISRLRPSSCYDVTLPLRLSAHVYSRRKRGAVRLRFQLDYDNQRDALISYLPSTLKIKAPKHTVPDVRTTVKCTDTTSFRNIALTVHGNHLPGKFSFNHFRATLKEFNFSRRYTMQLIRFTIRDTRRWVNPSISCFVFCAWMHCVYEDSFGLVPAYYVTFLLLHYFKNYSFYAIDGPASRGFLPPTWEEMFSALVSKNVEPIEPLSLERLEEYALPLETKMHETHSTGPVSFEIDTHRPKGKWLLRLFGFLESNKALREIPADERHLEFPMANSDLYPKLRVRQCLYVQPKKKDTKKDQKKDQKKEKQANDSKKKKKDAPKTDLPTFEIDINQDSSSLTIGPNQDSQHSTISDSATSKDEQCQVTADDWSAMDHNTMDHDPSVNISDPKEDPDAPKNIPDQDIDFVIDSGGKKLTDDLIEIRENCHRITWNLFNDKTYVIKDPDATYFGVGKKSEKKETERQLQKLLNVGSFSVGNPFIARAGLYMMPLVGTALAFLSVFRASFNIWTWRDPFISFWFSIFGILLAIILFLFPWRLFFFVYGIFFVGPQNFFIRLIQERRGTTESKKKVENKSSNTGPREQPLFKSHPQINQQHEEIEEEHINPHKVHHVVVPYSPLMYSNRFYDWPPEPEYASVKPRQFSTRPHSKSADSSQFSTRPHSKSADSSRSRSNSGGYLSSKHSNGKRFDFSGSNSTSSDGNNTPKGGHSVIGYEGEEIIRGYDGVPPEINAEEGSVARISNRKHKVQRRKSFPPSTRKNEQIPTLQPKYYAMSPKGYKYE